jgi:MFS family permease
MVGMVSGGPLFDYFGGYRNESRTRLLCMVISLTAVLGSPMMLYPSTPTVFLVAVAGNAAIIGMILPALMGSMINSVPQRMRSLASGVYGTICSFLGFQLAPIVVGFAADYTGNIMMGWRLAVGPCIVLAPTCCFVAWLRNYLQLSGPQKGEDDDSEDANGAELTDME